MGAFHETAVAQTNALTVTVSGYGKRISLLLLAVHTIGSRAYSVGSMIHAYAGHTFPVNVGT